MSWAPMAIRYSCLRRKPAERRTARNHPAAHDPNDHGPWSGWYQKCHGTTRILRWQPHATLVCTFCKSHRDFSENVDNVGSCLHQINTIKPDRKGPVLNLPIWRIWNRAHHIQPEVSLHRACPPDCKRLPSNRRRQSRRPDASPLPPFPLSPPQDRKP